MNFSLRFYFRRNVHLKSFALGSLICTEDVSDCAPRNLTYSWMLELECVWYLLRNRRTRMFDGTSFLSVDKATSSYIFVSFHSLYLTFARTLAILKFEPAQCGMRSELLFLLPFSCLHPLYSPLDLRLESYFNVPCINFAPNIFYFVV